MSDADVPVVAPSAQAWSAPAGDSGALILHGFTGNPRRCGHSRRGGHDGARAADRDTDGRGTTF